MLRLLAIGLVVCGACYRPTAEVGAPCSADGACPSGQRCDHAQVPPACTLGGGSAVDATPGFDTPITFEDAPPTSCGSHPACGPDEPVCDAGACRGCTADAECPSNACDEIAGTCWSESRVAYVALGGDDGTNGCTRTHPCAKLSTALARRGARDVFAIGKGHFDDAVLFDNVPTDLYVSGPTSDYGDAEIEFVATPSLVHTFEVRNTNLQIGHLTFYGGDQNVLHVRDGADVTLVACSVRDTTSHCIDTVSAGVHAFASLVIHCGGDAVHAESGGELELDRDFIGDNGGNGVDTGTSAFSLTNDIIVANGGAGVVVEATGVPNPARFDFNTVGFNSPPNGCLRATIAMHASNSLCFGSGDTPQISASVAVTYTLVDDVAPAGTGNKQGTPTFVDVDHDDFHLAAGSLGIDVADPAATEDHDYDYDPRPRNGRSDMGADER